MCRQAKVVTQQPKLTQCNFANCNRPQYRKKSQETRSTEQGLFTANGMPIFKCGATVRCLFRWICISVVMYRERAGCTRCRFACISGYPPHRRVARGRSTRSRLGWMQEAKAGRLSEGKEEKKLWSPAVAQPSGKRLRSLDRTRDSLASSVHGTGRTDAGPFVCVCALDA